MYRTRVSIAGPLLANRTSYRPSYLAGYQALKPQKTTRGLKFRIQEVDGLFYLHVCSENKSADHLCADAAKLIRFFFRKCKKQTRDAAQLSSGGQRRLADQTRHLLRLILVFAGRQRYISVYGTGFSYFLKDLPFSIP